MERDQSMSESKITLHDFKLVGFVSVPGPVDGDPDELRRLASIEMIARLTRGTLELARFQLFTYGGGSADRTTPLKQDDWR